ncbi:TetR/AcrR family transcriptional regulator C-terminal domain-containing protein [Streptosporangium vulgare]|uniref:TetR/AcrR family transcriptional regulator C-terminal domain-containing protein n=1 Tax=Streptosporangium vulgare TaxID=46190 RepID=UPI0031CEA4AD
MAGLPDPQRPKPAQGDALSPRRWTTDRISRTEKPHIDNAIPQIGLLEASGFTGTDAVLAYIAVSRYTIGATLEQQTARDGGAIILPPERTDAATAHLAQLAATVTALGPDHEFEVGLSALIHGLGELIATPTTDTLSRDARARRGLDECCDEPSAGRLDE